MRAVAAAASLTKAVTTMCQDMRACVLGCTLPSYACMRAWLHAAAPLVVLPSARHSPLPPHTPVRPCLSPHTPLHPSTPHTLLPDTFFYLSFSSCLTSCGAGVGSVLSGPGWLSPFMILLLMFTRSSSTDISACRRRISDRMSSLVLQWQ